MKKIIFILFLLFVFSISGVVAQTTPTPKASPTPTEGRLQEIKERVEERLQEIREKGQKKAVWGTLKQISNSTLVLDTSRGERRVKTTEETKVSLDKKAVELTDLGIGNFIIALGSRDLNDNFVAKRILAYTKPPKPTPLRQAIYGKVTDISPEEKVLTVTHPKKPNIVYEVKVTNKTITTKKVDGPPAGEARKIKKVNFEAIEIGDRIVAVAAKDKDSNSFTAKLIHVIPGKTTGLEKQTTPTPTPKKPTPTPTPTE